MTHRALLRALTTLSAALALVATTFSLAPAGVAHAPSTEQTNVVARTAGASVSTRVLRAKNIALGQLGDPYAYGAAGPHRFDCSGLVFFATHAAGFRGVPRTSGAQAGLHATDRQVADAPGRLHVLLRPRWRLPRRDLPRLGPRWCSNGARPPAPVVG
jgi:cell wall-associated NlpC family hydrolase